MAPDIIRDATLGQWLNYFFGVLPYADQRPDYVVPARYLSSAKPSTEPFSRPLSTAPTIVAEPEPALLKDASSPTSPLSAASRRQSALTLVNQAPGSGTVTPSNGNEKELEEKCKLRKTYRVDEDVEDGDTLCEEVRNELAKQSTPPQSPMKEALSFPASDSDYIVVDWDGPDDPDRPLNWSSRKRAFVAFQICLLTFSVYVGSAIYTASIPGLMTTFNVSSVHATWGLTLFVLAYGIGPMFLSPIQDMARFGRNPIYIYGLFLFALFQLPILWARNMSTVLAFRFFTGLVGSPALATGGASMGDIFPPGKLPYAIALWAIGAVFGPITGPVIGNFAAEYENWQWPILELIWIAAFASVVLFALLPETLESTILLKRARRLRKLTGNERLRSRGEIDAERQSTAEYVKTSLLRPFQLAMEPAILFANVYLGLVYGIFYLWFEAFPLVFSDIYHFRQGVAGLPFLSFIVSGALTFTAYVLYQKYHMEPRYARNAQLPPEVRLEIGLLAGIFIPISLLIFGWTSRASVHWIAPVIGAALYLPGIYLMFQSILIYITSSYPSEAGSVLAGNDFFRSTVASFFPLFGRTFFTALGLGGGSSLLAGLSLLLLPVLLGFVRWGDRLRARSKYAQS